MLYDAKRWDKTGQDIYELSSLIAWLEKQPADREYCYQDNGACLLGQYFKEMTGKSVLVGSVTINIWDDTVGMFERQIQLSLAFARISSERPHTFGAALDRARSWA